MKNRKKNWFDIIYNYLVVILRLAIAIRIHLELFESLWMNAALAAGILLLTFLPTIFASRVEVKIPPEFEVLTIAFIFASLFLGDTLAFYSRFWWWDIALHTTSGVPLDSAVPVDALPIAALTTWPSHCQTVRPI